ncbi:2OG-Fe(II) oxygenase [Thiotrichales bacterium 19X7-9]|nr:2OG-Fe(II) oxygenase [Thiotrichales bacterium 19X7-9]
MKSYFDQEWKNWIHHNISCGCDKDEIFNILLDHDYNPTAIIKEMQFQPHLEKTLTRVQELINSQIQPQNIVTNIPNFKALNQITLPSAQRLPTKKATLYLLDNFLNNNECNQLISLISTKLRPSTITNASEKDNTFRSSKTCDLSLLKNNFIKQIDQRIAQYMGIKLEYSEGIQGQYYQIGNQFKTHTDYFEPNTDEYQIYASSMGQRTWTFMIYLNNVKSGGHTDFPKLGISIKPKKGQAAIWNNLKEDGNVNPNTAHWGKPILQGQKFIITKWFRTHSSLST